VHRAEYGPLASLYERFGRPGSPAAQ
jgi:hypothetical protein